MLWQGLLRETIARSPGAPQVRQFRFTAPGQKHLMDSQWLIVSLTSRRDGAVLLRRCFVRDAK